MQAFLSYLSPTLIFPILTLTAVLLFIGYCWSTVCRPQRGTLDWVSRRSAQTPRLRLHFPATRHPMERKDLLPLLLLTAVYALTAFWNLGALTNPQQFQRFTPGDETVLELPETASLARLLYYPGLGTGDYQIKVSADGAQWFTLTAQTAEDVTTYVWQDAEDAQDVYAVPQHYADLFKWISLTPQTPIAARYVAVSARADADWVNLGELALYDESGALLRPLDGAALTDEQTVVPAKSTWENSTYFDEIYHARTALEHLTGVYPYEISHPPLGKLLLSLGIALFGMVPFGWRFMGTLFGVAMLPLLYCFLKNLFGKTPVAFCGTALFAFDFMHLTQTRIATIDTYAVFFILGMYYFLYRYLTLPAGTPFRRGVPDLLLSGLFWGLGAASKWTVIYGGVGLALLYFVGLWLKTRDWPQDGAVAYGPWLAKTLAFSVFSFVIIPAVIYLLAYLPYALAKGDSSLSGLIATLWDNQKYMFTYHNGVHDAHPYSSRWYQWVVDARPILYYLDSTSVPGMKTAFGAFSNPIVCWGGLLAMLLVVYQGFRRRSAQALFIVVGYLSQLAPWFFIGRTTFEYHYFPSIVFLVLALSYLFNDLFDRDAARARLPVYGMTGGAAALYALFYPVLVGIPLPVWFSDALLRWLPSWPF